MANGIVEQPVAGHFDIVSGTMERKNPKDRLLHLENVCKQYGDKVVLDNVDLCVQEGEFVAVVGPSGCGKSTLLRLILGNEEATSGDLFLDGAPIGFPDPTRGIVDQRYALFPNLTVLENVLMPHRLKLTRKEWKKQRYDLMREAVDVLKTSQLFEHRDKYPHQLSGGQQQRAAVMQALVNNPKVLLMDEPFGALDPGSRERMQTFLLQRWEETRKTIFFVTHDLEEAVFLATRVVVLSQYYTDDRAGIDIRGSRIVADIKTGVIGQAFSTRSKLNPRFTETIEHIRDLGFKPDQLHHVREFDLNHPDSFHTVSEAELNGSH